MENAIELINVTKRFPGMVANDQISLAIRTGEIHAIVGENGAGKSTLMRLITGLYQPDEGEIRFHGQTIMLDGPAAAIAQGVGMVHQHFMLINRFNVVENVILGYEKSRGLLDLTRACAQVAALCKTYDFKFDLECPVEELSVGHRQRLEILKILYRGADILILDEPTAVLTPQESGELFTNLRRLKAEGKTILFISHKLDEVLAIADRVSVLRRGKLVATVLAGETDRSRLAVAMVGRPVTWATEKAIIADTATVLSIQTLCSENAGKKQLDQLSLTVSGGEIYGVAGVEGNGQRELVEAIMGLTAYTGEIRIKEQSTRGLSTTTIRELGVAYIPEDRHSRGVVLPFSVRENTVLGLVRKPEFSSYWRMRLETIKHFSAAKMVEFDIRLSSDEVTARTLSGGNQQKVILARELSSDPDLVIAAQPVRGLDIGAIEFVRKKLLDVRNRGKAVLLISADLEEVLSLADRVGILYEGQIVCEFRPGELTAAEISRYMLGAAEGGAN